MLPIGQIVGYYSQSLTVIVCYTVFQTCGDCHDADCFLKDSDSPYPRNSSSERLGICFLTCEARLSTANTGTPAVNFSSENKTAFSFKPGLTDFITKTSFKQENLESSWKKLVFFW